MKLPCLLLIGGLLAGPLAVPHAGAQSITIRMNRDLPEFKLDWLTSQENLWDVSQEDFEKAMGRRKFVWQDKERTRARFNPDDFSLSLNEKKVGETLVSFKDGKLASVTISFLNKGDEDEIIDQSKFTAAKEDVRSILSAISGAKEEPRRKGEMVTKAEGGVWRSKKGLFIGEWLFLPEKKTEIDGWIWTTKAHGEFVRMRLLPPQALLGTQLKQAKASVTRAQLAAMVNRTGTKAVLEGVPMVDQGSKGYCAVASFERVLRYYGADVDMHDLANLAETYGGTNPQKMKDAVFKVAQKLGMRTREPFFLKAKQYESLFKDYNKYAKKAGKTVVDLDWSAWEDVDSDLLMECRSKSADFMKFKQEVVSNINKGIPIMWALELGLFWEDKIEESYEANRYAVTKDDSDTDKEDADREKKRKEERDKEMEEMRKKSKRPPSYMMGGHMRLIVGYDTAEQVIYYTDSWGPGHEMKKMPITQAFAGTMAMFIIEPQ